MKNNRLKVIVHDGLGGKTEKNFTNLRDADKYHDAMYRKLFLTVHKVKPILSELKILRLNHEI